MTGCMCLLHGFHIITCGGKLKLVFVTKFERPAEITLYNNSLMNMYDVMNMYIHEHVQCHGIYILLHMYMYMYIHIDYQS